MGTNTVDTLAVNEAQGLGRPRLSPAAIFAIAILGVFTILITWRAALLETRLQEEAEEPELVHKQAPDFTVETIDGRAVSLADFRGQKKVVVAFWASWCGPCRMEMPTLVRFYKKNHNDSSDFEFLALSIDEDPKAAANFASSMKLNFPVLLDTSKKVADAYKVEGIPTMFVIDKNGTVIYGHAGFDVGMEFRLMTSLGITTNNGVGGRD